VPLWRGMPTRDYSGAVTTARAAVRTSGMGWARRRRICARQGAGQPRSAPLGQGYRHQARAQAAVVCEHGGGGTDGAGLGAAAVVSGSSDPVSEFGGDPCGGDGLIIDEVADFGEAGSQLSRIGAVQLDGGQQKLRPRWRQVRLDRELPPGAGQRSPVQARVGLPGPLGCACDDKLQTLPGRTVTAGIVVVGRDGVEGGEAAGQLGQHRTRPPGP
jgi:hypothetical protein